MKTTLDCLPCFLQQALKTAKLSTSSTDVQKNIMKRALKFLEGLDLEKTPPENAVGLYALIAEISVCPDPFAAIKEKSNNFALHLKSHISEKINQQKDPLQAALLFSIAGNIIDYGAIHSFDMEQTIHNALDHELAINDYSALEQDLKRAKKILYLADNSGELVFDAIVIEKLTQHEVIVAVKEKPIINDATIEDAHKCGLKKLCRIITNGTGCPGTPLTTCSKEFQKIFHEADLIISKGQGNFETLSDVNAPIYFLLTVKCPVIRDHIARTSGQDVQCGQLLLMKGKKLSHPPG